MMSVVSKAQSDSIETAQKSTEKTDRNFIILCWDKSYRRLYGNGVKGYTIFTIRMLATRMMRFISRPMRMKSLKR